MTAKRFTTTSHHDPTITQKVRTALYESGNEDLVDEIIIDGMRDIESMARDGLTDHERRLKILEEAERERLTKTGVWTFVKAKLDAETVSWVTWAKRAALTGLGGALLTGLGLLIKLAWKGLSVK